MSFTAILSANINQFSDAIDSAKKQVDKLESDVGKSLKNIGDSFTNIGKKMSVFTVAFTGMAAAGFNMASDLEDAMGATDEVFRQSSEQAKKWASQLSSDYGIAKKEALEYQNLMGTMLQNIGGLTEDMAQKSGSKLIELAGDLTAMYGGSTSEAVYALTAALRGITIPMNRYGVAINDAMLKDKAFAMGLTKSTTEMSIQAKQAATLALIWEQTSAAQGQASREAESASGAMRSFTTAVKNLTTAFGEVLLPILTPIIQKLTALAENFTTLNPAIQKTIVIVGGLVAGISPLLLALGQLLKILPLIKTAVIALGAAMSTAMITVTALAAAFLLIYNNWELLKESISKDTEFINERLANLGDTAGKLFTGNFKGWWDSLIKGINLDMDYLKRRWSEFKEIFGFSKSDKIEPVTENTGVMVGALSTSLKALSTDLDTASSSSNDLKDGLKETAKAIEDTRNTFDKFIEPTKSIGEAIKLTDQTIANLKQRILDLQTGRLFSYDITGEIDDLNGLIKELQDGLNTLTGGREYNLKVSIDARSMFEDSKLFGESGSKFFKDGKFTFPPINADHLMASLDNATAMVLDYGNLIGSGLASFASTIGDAFGSGNFSDLGKNLISSLGRLAQQFGSMLIALGTASLQLKTLIANPFTAIAAGAALVALGSAASSMAQKTVNNAISGGGGSNSYQTTSPSYGASDYRGMYQDNWGGNVTFRIGNNELVGVLEQANNRKNRL